MKYFAWLCAVVIVAAASEARAEPTSEAWSTPFIVNAHLEAVPILLDGFNGVTVEVAPSRWTSLEVGGGSWFLSPAALAIAHLQVPIGRAAFGLDAGLLTGSFGFGDGCEYDRFGGEGCADDLTTNALGHPSGLRVRNAVFARLGPSFAWRSARGRFQMRWFTGATWLVNRRVGTFVDEVTGRESGSFVVDSQTLPTMLYVGVTLGYGFRL